MAGHPTYHVNVIKLKWENIWTGRLPHLPGVSPPLPPNFTQTSPMAPSTGICFCLKTEIFFLWFQKDLLPHVAFLNGFCPPTRQRNGDWKWFENGTIFERSMRIYWYPTQWCNHFQNTSNSSNHKSTAKWHLQTFPLWIVLLKWCAVTFRWPFSTDTCGYSYIYVLWLTKSGLWAWILEQL